MKKFTYSRRSVAELAADAALRRLKELGLIDSSDEADSGTLYRLSDRFTGRTEGGPFSRS